MDQTPRVPVTPRQRTIPADLPPHLAALLDDITRRRREAHEPLPAREPDRADGIEPVTTMLALVVIAASCVALYVGLTILACGDGLLLTHLAPDGPDPLAFELASLAGPGPDAVSLC